MKKNQIILGDSIKEMKKLKDHSVDLIFADPPYFKKMGDIDFVQKLLDSAELKKLLAEDGILILEDPPHHPRGDSEGWQLIDQRQYGGCRILFYQASH